MPRDDGNSVEVPPRQGSGFVMVRGLLPSTVPALSGNYTADSRLRKVKGGQAMANHPQGWAAANKGCEEALHPQQPAEGSTQVCPEGVGLTFCTTL